MGFLTGNLSVVLAYVRLGSLASPVVVPCRGASVAMYWPVRHACVKCGYILA